LDSYFYFRNPKTMRNTNIILICLGFLLLTAPVSADGKEENGGGETMETVLAGKITDILSGEELAGVRVQLDGTDLITYTGFEGEFRFEGLKPGTYYLVTSMISYKNSRIKVETGKDVRKPSGIMIRLKPD